MSYYEEKYRNMKSAASGRERKISDFWSHYASCVRSWNGVPARITAEELSIVALYGSTTAMVD